MNPHFFKRRHTPPQRRKRMITAAETMVIHSDDGLEVTTSDGGRGIRDRGGTWSP